MLYDSGNVGESDGSSSIDGSNIYKRRVEPVLVSLSGSYLELDSISIVVSRCYGVLRH